MNMKMANVPLTYGDRRSGVDTLTRQPLDSAVRPRWGAYQDGARVTLGALIEPEPPRRTARPDGCCCDHLGWVDAGCRLHGLRMPWPQQDREVWAKPQGWRGRTPDGSLL